MANANTNSSRRYSDIVADKMSSDNEVRTPEASGAVASPSPPRAQVKRKSANDYTSLDALVVGHTEAFRDLYRSREVRRDTLPILASDPTMGSLRLEHYEGDTIVNSALILPLVTIEFMPSVAYPEHMGYMIRATLAAARASSAVTAHMLDDPFVAQLMSMMVAVRCGVWASVGCVPGSKAHPASIATTYREKRHKAFRKPMIRTSNLEAWYKAFDEVPRISAQMEELTHWLAHVSPVLLALQCAEEVRTAETFSTPYVQQALSRHLRSKLTPEAYGLANLSKACVWSALQSSAVAGLPNRAVAAWAVDPLFQLQAQRRLLSTTSELAASKRREDSLKSNSTPLTIDYEASSTIGFDTGFAAAVRSNHRAEQEDDLVSVSGLSLWGDIEEGEKNGTYGHSPVMSVADVTAVPSRSTSPAPQLTAQDAAQIREHIRNAASLGPRAASEARDANDELPVQWD